MYLFVIGTRPEAIKISPLIIKFRENHIPYKVLLTGQHTSMVYDVLNVFKIQPDYNLNIMKPNQSINYIHGEVVAKLDAILINTSFDYIIVHGDTTTAMSAALCAFHNKVKIIHIEAGLRTSNLFLPFPEESNRRIISTIASVSFIPTQSNYDNLMRENNSSSKHIVGNTVIDAFEYVRKMYKLPRINDSEPFILLTVHRRENLSNLSSIFKAIDYISRKFKMKIIYPMHPNPVIRKIFDESINDNQFIQIIPPQNYIDFCELLIMSKIIITDSGGVQEEASHLNKPIIVLRDETERQEAVFFGNAILAGTQQDKIESIATEIISKTLSNSLTIKSECPFGSGNACDEICRILLSTDFK